MFSANSIHLEFQIMCAYWMSNNVAEDRVRKGITVSMRTRWQRVLKRGNEDIPGQGSSVKLQRGDCV